jgi:hypothetical protein
MAQRRTTTQFWPFFKALKANVKFSCFGFGALIFLVSFLFVMPVLAVSENYPKLANYYLKTPISASEVQELAKWDVVILGMQVQDTNPEIFNQLKILNPQIKIIAYLSAMEFPFQNYAQLESATGPWHKMWQQINNDWFLKDGSGNIHSIWPGNYSFNLTKYCPTINGQKFNIFLANFVKRELMDTGHWDGVFYDNVLDSIKDTNNGLVDIDNNLKVDEKNFADSEWHQGILILLAETRKLLGNKIIMVNSSSYGQDYINGRLYETWPHAWLGGWAGSMRDYVKLEKNISATPQVIVLNPNTDNNGNQYDYQKVRFGLASTLLGNGYFAFDWGTQDHSQLWRYDEYEVNLGQAISNAKNLLNKNNTPYENSVWRRDFENGIVLVNATNQNQKIKLDDAVYEKIRGQQDVVNNGELVNEVKLAPQDGLILLRKLELKSEVMEKNNGETEIKENILRGFVFKNGDYIRVFDKQGKVKRTGFYAYDPRFPGGSQIVNEDLNNDGELETVVADKGKVEIFKANGSVFSSFYPLGKNYKKEISLAVGNVVGDAKKEIVIGAGSGIEPAVKIFDLAGNAVNQGWLAYDQNFKGGVKVALGDLNGDGYKEIVVGSGNGGGPHVRIFNGQGKLVDPGFFAYDQNFRGGVNVTCADLNNDGKDEIITGAGKGGGPHVRIFDNKGRLADPGFFAYDKNKRTGVKVGAADVDGDGVAEVLARE